jgi:hypothetical protein
MNEPKFEKAIKNLGLSVKRTEPFRYEGDANEVALFATMCLVAEHCRPKDIHYDKLGNGRLAVTFRIRSDQKAYLTSRV